MTEFYPQIKWVHVAAAMTSGTLFFLRGLAIPQRAPCQLNVPVERLWLPDRLR